MLECQQVVDGQKLVLYLSIVVELAVLELGLMLLPIFPRQSHKYVLMVPYTAELHELELMLLEIFQSHKYEFMVP